MSTRSAGPAAAPGPDVLVLDAVSKTYRNRSQQVTALDSVSARFEAGTFTSVMGPSGSGKSTLLTCAAGLLGVTSGSVQLAGIEVTCASQDQLTRMRRDRVGFVFQSFNLVPSLTAAQNVELPLLLSGDRTGRRRAREALARVGLADRAGHRPEQLSGGQQQRVAVARAFVTRPQVIFADEPTGALDRATGAVVLDLFREAVDEGACLVCVTHDPAVATRADRVLYLLDGRLVDSRPREGADAIAARLADLDLQGRTA